MNSKKTIVIIVLTLAFMFVMPKVSEAAQMGTGFTYQGRLIDANEAADGLYDFQFRLYDADIGGNQKGEDVNMPETDVIDGYFTVMLDVNDPCAFNGDARWLEIGVRPGDQNDPNSYTVLLPRQEVTPTPYALALPGLWTKQNSTSPNIIGGYNGNIVANGVYGATIGGGGQPDFLNKVMADMSTIGGGYGNTCSGFASTVGGGWENTASAYDSVGGGAVNNASGGYATIGGGHSNTASGFRATVGGGYTNTADGWYAGVGSGEYNQAINNYDTVGGGRLNITQGGHATVGGGYSNVARGEHATVSGGDRNQSSGFASSIGGGHENTANGDYATVAGGQNNDANGDDNRESE